MAVRKWLLRVGVAVCAAQGVWAAPATETPDAVAAWTEAQAALVAGRWQEAIRLGQAVGSADGLALAAEALSIQAHFEADAAQRPVLLLQAVALAQQAVELQPADPQVRFQLAHAMGRYAQSIPSTQALRGGYVRRTRQLAEDVLALNPDMVQALLQLGSWHAEVVARAGSLVARLTYGAKVSAALEYYERALELSEDDLGVYAEVGRGLLLLSRRHEARALDLLRRAVALEPRDAYERIRQRQAAAQLAEFR